MRLKATWLGFLCHAFHVSFSRISQATASQVSICGQEDGFYSTGAAPSEAVVTTYYTRGKNETWQEN